MTLRSLLTFGLFATSALALPQAATTTSATNTIPSTTVKATATGTRTPGLHVAAKKAGKLWFGTAADIPGPELQDKAYMKEFNNYKDFGEVTPANYMKFVYTEPEQGVFNFTGAEQFLKAAEQNGKRYIRCHNLIWHQQLPSWVTSPSTPWTNATLSAVLKTHASTLVKHFGDRCYSWDVVNEAFSDNPAGAYGSNVWYDTIGPEYVAMAFKAAQDAIKANKLNVKLYYNDYSIEFAGGKSTAAQNLVKQLKARGIQIDGIGLESHFIGGSTPSFAEQVANMKNFTALGVDVVVTELDVRLTMPPSAAAQIQQAQDYYNTVAACVAVKRCKGITVWDFDDTYSWVPSTFPGQGYADLFVQKTNSAGMSNGSPLTKKVAYDGCLQALQGKPFTAPTVKRMVKSG